MFANVHLRPLVLPLILGLLMAVFGMATPYFFSPENLMNALVASATVGVLAVGAALVIGAGGIDLSVGAVMGFASSMVMALALFPFLNGWELIFLCVLAGVAVGVGNGLLAALTTLPPFIITLASMSIVRGLAFIFMDGRPQYGLPAEVVALGQSEFLGIPLPIVLFALVAGAGHFLLTQTRFGRHLCAYGDNPQAVAANGVDILWLKVQVYGFSGLCGALAGLIFMGRLNSADPTAGMMYEFSAITAAIMGGASLSGGKTSVIGAVVGAVILGVLQNGLNLLAIPSFYQYVVTGLALLAVVLLHTRGEK